MAAAVPTVTDLAGRSFTSASVQGKELVEGSVLRLSFDEDRMAAHAGCNSMGGPYRIEDGHLAWAGAVVSTMMACSEELMDQDRWIAELLEAGVAVRSEGSGLVLSTDDLIIVLDGEPDTSGGERHDAPGSVETGATTSPSLEDW